MIPFGDSVRVRRFPFVNVSLIAISVCVFLAELAMGSSLDAFLARWAVLPVDIVDAIQGQSELPFSALITLVTAQFLHGGWVHLGGNMLFLWIFGDNVEDRLGHVRYLIFYVFCGILANLIQVLSMPNSEVPIVGASGAIAAVLGAYLVIHPRAWVSVLIPIFFLWPLEVPVVLLLGFWFLSQLANGVAAISEVTQVTGGVAWWAHVGGFATGAIVMAVYGKFSKARASFQWLPGPSGRGRNGTLLLKVLRIVTYVGNAVILLVFVRLVFKFFQLEPVGSLGFLVNVVYCLSQPFVAPSARMVPAVGVDGFTIEFYSLLSIAIYYVLLVIACWGLTSIANRFPARKARRAKRRD